ncbi:MAG: hypothetical protein A2Z99_15400 [Treponema sp. GWB1_62_6]|nr:MAG: hypothetical protein A2001_10985 [Treponema sp. GWC1_61_84]OHE68192.1 MAG: hypothetical protein A2413_01450 [Treponema sp. RIFOXYC1_FULL_61_9]OHE71383.1 MAG: hypothetical protein A2Z99_15400 [Treponema sp. GWB1_62_6]
MGQAILDEEERERYSRQTMLPAWGEEGQLRLKRSVVFVAGLGGLGGPVCLYLAAAGVGTLILCDDGLVEISNLNRQLLYDEADLGKPKTAAAARKLRGLNPRTETVERRVRLREGSVAGIASDADILVDCLDNYQARQVLNAHAVRAGLPLLHGGVLGAGGQFAFLFPPLTPCLHCIFPDDAAERSAPLPAVGPAAGMVASVQALAALRYLVFGEPTMPNLFWRTDGWNPQAEALEIQRDERCPVCGRIS